MPIRRTCVIKSRIFFGMVSSDGFSVADKHVDGLALRFA